MERRVPTAIKGSTSVVVPITMMRKTLSWLAFALGALVSVIVLARICEFGFSIDGPLPNNLEELGVILTAFVPLSASLVAFRNRRWATYLFLASLPILLFCESYSTVSYWADSDRTAVLIGDCLLLAPFLVLGLFWFVTHRLAWSPLLLTWPKSVIRRTASISVGFLLLVATVLAATLAMAAHIPPIGDCGAPPPFAKQQRPNQAAFTARIIEIPILGPIGVVGQRFWGLHSWESTLVLVQAGPWFKTGDTWLIIGNRQKGLIDLPVFEIWCSRSARISEAELDLRLLRDGPPKDGVRVIGRAVRFQHDFSEQGVPGVEITITGPLGNVTATTDAHGIYDKVDLPPGAYTIRSDSDAEPPAMHPAQNLKAGDIGGRTLVLK